ncbi:Tetratricopeptide repeat protein 4 [Trichinella sp. T8]|nr:Tetratricopeptide repeat protein 4 [Trichinella sp. T8]
MHGSKIIFHFFNVIYIIKFNFLFWEIESHPAFMKQLPADDKPMSEAMQALQALKYGSDQPPEELAMEYKIDGNEWFLKGKYDTAIKSYTEGIKLHCSDKNLNSILYANRGAAHFLLKNFRSCLKDCSRAKMLNPTHKKAIKRGVQCLISLGEFDAAFDWLQELKAQASSDSELDEVKSLETAIAEQRNARFELEKLREREAEKEANESTSLFIALTLGNFKVADFEIPLLAESCRVHLKDGFLLWPVLFRNAEHESLGLIKDFHEQLKFEEQLQEMAKEDPFYNPLDVELYFYSCLEPDTLVFVPLGQKLGAALSHEHYEISDNLPDFYCINKTTSYHAQFLTGMKSRQNFGFCLLPLAVSVKCKFQVKIVSQSFTRASKFAFEFRKSYTSNQAFRWEVQCDYNKRVLPVALLTQTVVSCLRDDK